MKKGMIKVSLFYPPSKSRAFDMTYYLEKHVPMVVGLLGDAVKGATIEKGLAGGEPGAAAPYAVTGNIYFESMESFQNSFGANADKILGDVPNYTDAGFVVQVGEVLV